MEIAPSSLSLSLSLVPILLLATPSLIPPLQTHIALQGRPSYLSIMQLSLGLQTPLNPRVLNDGEYPACAAMTTGVSDISFPTKPGLRACGDNQDSNQ